MLLGLRASLPKLPSFKVKRTPEVEVVSGSRKRSNTESSEVLERQTKKQIMEEPDLEMDAELENSSGSYKRLRLNNRLEEVERSQSPFQQLDDNVDVAPRATIVRYSEGKHLKAVSTGLVVAISDNKIGMYECLFVGRGSRWFVMAEVAYYSLYII